MPVEHVTDSATGESVAPTVSGPSKWRLFWRAVVKFDRQKVIPWIALRNSIAVALPLGIGVSLGAKLSGAAMATGALNVSYSDGGDPYNTRARRMLLSCFLTTAAVFLGGLVSHHNICAVLASVIWAFPAGLAVALGPTAADLGVISLVTLVIFSAQALTLQNASWAALLALSGGLFQTALSLILWPIRRYEPERRALGQLFGELARMATASVSADRPPPASQASTQAQQMLSRLGQDRNIEGERYRLLLSQAERIRLCFLTLSRLRSRLLREHQDDPGLPIIGRFLEIASDVLYSVNLSFTSDESLAAARRDLDLLSECAEALRSLALDGLPPFVRAMREDAQVQLDALAGQLRAVVNLSEHASPEGAIAFDRRESAKPAALRLVSSFTTLRANLTLKSAACRHAIRLTVCLAAGDALSRALDWRRSYWLPMTIVIVLKPDFTATFSRGVLRFAGTFAGLGLATILFRFFHLSPLMQVLLVAVFTYSLRCWGPANYGILVVSITALIVLLVGFTGISAYQVIEARAVNTAAGGLLALLAYWVWPTWERTQVRDAFANLLDAYRAYFRGIVDSYTQAPQQPDLDARRLDARLARSNAEASADRLSAEPGVSAEQAHLCTAMLASSHTLVHALMALEAGIASSKPVPPRDAFRLFAKDVDLTLYYLSAALRGSPLSKKHLPDLREDHRKLLASGDPHIERYALVNIETDRITNSLNTLQEQVSRLIALK